MGREYINPRNILDKVKHSGQTVNESKSMRAWYECWMGCFAELTGFEWLSTYKVEKVDSEFAGGVEGSHWKHALRRFCKTGVLSWTPLKQEELNTYTCSKLTCMTTEILWNYILSNSCASCRLWLLGWLTNVDDQWPCLDLDLVSKKAVDDLRHRGFWTFLWMISASGLHRGWTPWTQEWACKSVDPLLRLDLTINFHKFHHQHQPHKHQHPLPLPAAHPPYHIILPFVSRHHLFLFIRDKSLKVYPNRKLFSSWKVCKCKTAPPSSEGEQNHLNVETEKHIIHKYTKTQICKYIKIPQS